MFLLYSGIISSRLKYISDFIGNEMLGQPFELTSDSEKFKQYSGPKINYSRQRITNEELGIGNWELLFANNISSQSIQCFEVNGYKAFFKTENCDFPFDIFAASFYLLSRYEEYLPYQKDMYGRYAHENSLAFKENFLHLPLINIWLKDFKKALQLKFPFLPTLHSPKESLRTPFTFFPTYDIDIAYSYKNKGWLRTAGGIFKSIFSGQWSVVNERINVLSKKQKDPFDVYDWLDKIHKKYNLKPYYFFHVASKRGKYDKNISPANKQMQELIRQHAKRYNTGVHPSWQSGDDTPLLKKEIQILENITQQKINVSRQHFIRFTLPQTFQQLIASGISSDFSMGYGSINGFRASISSPFFWYDLEREEQTSLLLYPFCYMDANSFYEQKFSPQQALEEMRQYYAVIKSVNGNMITIWHNSFLGTDKMFAGWKEVYESFIFGLSSSSPGSGGATIDEIL